MTRAEETHSNLHSGLWGKFGALVYSSDEKHGDGLSINICLILGFWVEHSRTVESSLFFQLPARQLGILVSKTSTRLTSRIAHASSDSFSLILPLGKLHPALDFHPRTRIT